MHKVSSSLVDAVIYYTKNPSVAQLQQLRDRLSGIFVSNEFMKAGIDYEVSVQEGNAGAVSQFLQHCDFQKWTNTTISNNGIQYYLSGKVDAIDKDYIYDIKRVGKYRPEKYSDDNTTQANFYFYLNKHIKGFIYIIAHGDITKEPTGVQTIFKPRPTDEYLEEYVHYFLEFFKTTLTNLGLWELYKQNSIK